MVTLFVLSVNDISNALLALKNNIPHSIERGVKRCGLVWQYIHNARHLFVFSGIFDYAIFGDIFIYLTDDYSIQNNVAQFLANCYDTRSN